MQSVKIETITVTLTADEAYALCNKLDDKSLVTHGGYCEFDQIKLLQRIGKEIGKIVGHHAAKNDLSLDVIAAVRSANVQGVARRREDLQSEANEGRYPPLPLPSCSFSSSSVDGRGE